MLSEISQMEKDKCCMISLICEMFFKNIHRKKDQRCGVGKGELEESGGKVQTSSYKSVLGR